MTPLKPILAALLVTAAVGAGAWSYARRAPGPPATAAEAMERAGTVGLPDGPGDSIEVAGLAKALCGRLDISAKEKCYQKILLRLVAEDRVRLAMGSLHVIVEQDPSLVPYTHQYAHGIGIAAYAPDKDVGKVFRSCTEIFQSGCYHGVIQAYFMSKPRVDAQDVAALCADFTQATADQWLRFQCVHGMGHGLTMFYDHDLPRALTSCDLLTQVWDRESCYGGAFMENVVVTSMPHHHGDEAPPAAPADSAGQGRHAMADMPGMDMPGHDHAAMQTASATSTTPRFKPRDPKDPYYPCSVVGGKYLNACYAMQTSIMLEMNGRDFGKTARTCDGAPAEWRYTCYQSLGTNIAGQTPGDNAGAIRLCSLGNAAYQPWCYLGVVKNRIDVTAQAADGFAFCKDVPGEPNRLKCYEALGEEIGVLKNDLGDREAICSQSPAAYQDACRYGARVSSVVPQGMPGES
jgi:hypothetical protein